MTRERKREREREREKTGWQKGEGDIGEMGERAEEEGKGTKRLISQRDS